MIKNLNRYFLFTILLFTLIPFSNAGIFDRPEFKDELSKIKFFKSTLHKIPDLLSCSLENEDDIYEILDDQLKMEENLKYNSEFKQLKDEASKIHPTLLSWTVRDKSKKEEIKVDYDLNEVAATNLFDELKRIEKTLLPSINSCEKNCLDDLNRLITISLKIIPYDPNYLLQKIILELNLELNKDKKRDKSEKDKLFNLSFEEKISYLKTQDLSGVKFDDIPKWSLDELNSTYLEWKKLQHLLLLKNNLPLQSPSDLKKFALTTKEKEKESNKTLFDLRLDQDIKESPVKQSFKKEFQKLVESLLVRKVTDEKSKTALQIEEVPPLISLFRSYVGNDCATDSVGIMVNNPYEKVFYIYGPKGEVKGYLEGTIVDVTHKQSGKKERAFYIFGMNGTHLSEKDVEQTLESLNLKKESISKGVTRIIVPSERVIWENMNYVPIREALKKGQDPTSEYQISFPDSTLRKYLLTKVSEPKYDLEQNHLQGFDLKKREITSEKATVEIEERKSDTYSYITPTIEITDKDKLLYALYILENSDLDEDDEIDMAHKKMKSIFSGKDFYGLLEDLSYTIGNNNKLTTQKFLDSTLNKLNSFLKNNLKSKEQLTEKELLNDWAFLLQNGFILSKDILSPLLNNKDAIAPLRKRNINSFLNKMELGRDFGLYENAAIDNETDEDVSSLLQRKEFTSEFKKEAEYQKWLSDFLKEIGDLGELILKEDKFFDHEHSAMLKFSILNFVSLPKTPEFIQNNRVILDTIDKSLKSLIEKFTQKILKNGSIEQDIAAIIKELQRVAPKKTFGADIDERSEILFPISSALSKIKI